MPENPNENKVTPPSVYLLFDPASFQISKLASGNYCASTLRELLEKAFKKLEETEFSDKESQIYLALARTYAEPANREGISGSTLLLINGLSASAGEFTLDTILKEGDRVAILKLIDGG